MTSDQWPMLFDLLDNGWPGDLTEDQAHAYRTLLDGMDMAAIVAGLRRLLVRGARFRPSAAELIAAAREDAGQPTFAEAYRLVFGPRGYLWKGVESSLTARQWHPLIVSFVERQGAQRLRMLPVDDPDWGEKHRSDLERQWGIHVEAMEGREAAALAGGGEPRQLDPLRMAGLEPPRELPEGDAA